MSDDLSYARELIKRYNLVADPESVRDTLTTLHDIRGTLDKDPSTWTSTEAATIVFTILEAYAGVHDVPVKLSADWLNFIVGSLANAMPRLDEDLLMPWPRARSILIGSGIAERIMKRSG